MPTTASLLAFAVASTAVLMIPGPAVVHVLARSLEHGSRAGLYSMLGLETGAALHVGAASLGLAALVASSTVVFTIVRCAGIGYLLWLAAREFGDRSADSSGAANASTPCRFRLYRDGLLVDLLNPKTAIFLLAFLPQFIDPSRGSPTGQIVLLGGCFVALAAVCDSTYAVVAGGLGRRVGRTAGSRRRIGTAAGVAYLALATMAAVL